MEKSLRIAIGQINPCVGDLDGNAKKVLDYAAKAKSQDCDLVVFPELVVTGYPPEDLLLKKYFIEDNIDCAKKIAQNPIFNKMAGIFGFVSLDKSGAIYNSAAVVANSKIAGIYRKIKLPNYAVFDEKRYFSHGDKYTLVNINGTKVGLTICEDIWTDDDIPEIYSFAGGAQIILCISASPYHRRKLDDRISLVKRIAKNCMCHVCYVNMVGGQDELVFDGGSFIVDCNGNIMAFAREFQEDLLVYDFVHAQKVDSIRSKKKGSKAKKFSVCPKNFENIKIKLSYASKSPVRIQIADRCLDDEQVYNALVLGLRDYVRKNGFKQAVIGMSGGIDSALTAVIAKDALGAQNVIAVSMPSKYSSCETKTDAKIMAQNIGIRFIEVPINDMYENYLSTLSVVFSGTKPNLAEENLQARIRGTLLMAMSNKFGWIVLATGNKSEMAVGYATLYGDMAGGFAVLKDVTKTMVYRLSSYVNSKANSLVIPGSIIKRPPTAELRYNQKDEDDIPAYSILDSILDDYIENESSRPQMLKKGHDSQVVAKVVNMVDSNEYKRRQAPPGIKITPKAFGKDRRMPITNKYRG